MEIIIKSSTLKKSLEKISNIIPAKPTMTITGGILITTKEGEISLTATDLESTIKISTQCKIQEKGTVVVPGKKFIPLIKQMPEDEIKITGKENKIKVTDKKSQYSFNGMDYNEFPKFPKFSGDVLLKIKGKNLKNAIDKIKFCIDPEEPRVHFRGGYVDIEQNVCNFIGTDTKRLALMKLSLESKTEKKVTCLLPYKLMDIMTGLLSDEDVDVSIGKNQISFNFAGIYLVSQLLSGEENFPDYNKVIPDEKNLKKAFLVNSSFLATLKRISLFTSERYNKVKLSFGKNTLAFVVSSPEVGDGQEKMEIQYSGEEQNLAFQPGHLIDFLQKAEGEKIIFGFTNEKSPVLLKSESKPEFLYVAMPLKLE
jgi:DNA polymerase III subunit beta